MISVQGRSSAQAAVPAADEEAEEFVFVEILHKPNPAVPDDPEPDALSAQWHEVADEDLELTSLESPAASVSGDTSKLIDLCLQPDAESSEMGDLFRNIAVCSGVTLAVIGLFHLLKKS